MRSEESEEERGMCYLCPAGPLDEDFFCYGCNEFICEDHTGEPLGSHDPEDHLDEFEDD